MNFFTRKKKVAFIGLPLLLIFLILAYYQLLYRSPEVNSGIFELKRTFSAHKAEVWTAKFSPDGKFLASGSVDSTVNILNKNTGNLIHTLKHPAGVTTLAFNADGKYLASGSYDGIIRLWDVNAGKLVKQFPNNNSTVWAVAFSSDGTRIVSGGEDALVKIWDVPSGKLLKSLNGHKLNIWVVKVSPDGTKIASGSFDSTLKIWDAQSGKLLINITGHTQAIVDLAFNHTGNILATTSDDKTIKLWNVADGKLIRTMEAPEHIQAVAFSPDDKYLITGGRDKPMIGEFLQNIFGDSYFNKGVSARLWSIDDGKLIQTFRQQANDVNDVDYSPDGRYIATASADKTVQLWEQVRDMP